MGTIVSTLRISQSSLGFDSQTGFEQWGGFPCLYWIWYLFHLHDWHTFVYGRFRMLPTCAATALGRIPEQILPWRWQEICAVLVETDFVEGKPIRDIRAAHVQDPKT